MADVSGFKSLAYSSPRAEYRLRYTFDVLLLWQG